MTVSDTGCGMSEAVQRRICEPFFTTKEAGQGTGLGMATVSAVVKQAGGHIWLESEEGRGTTFRIYLPSVGKVPALEDVGRSLQPLPGGTETILLVEDDDSVRTLTQLVLRSAGYTVLEAADGTSALALCQTHEGPIDLLITDVVMPGLSGRQVADAVRRIQPTSRVLYLSGYTDDAVVRHGVVQAEAAFLQKPFTSAAIADKVRAVLDSCMDAAGCRES